MNTSNDDPNVKNSSSDETSSETSSETGTSPPTKIINIPINLMKRWQTLYKPDSNDSDSEDSEYEYEEDDPSSPYHTEMTLDITPRPEVLEILSEWVDNISSHEKDFLDQMNKKTMSNGETWTIVEERIQVSISTTFYEQLFHSKVFCADFMCLQFRLVFFWQKEIGAKAARKMLV